jgi:3-deoxy-D-manno-octulosonic-acid transferase
VGEVNAAAPLLSAIMTSPRAPKVVLTSSTAAGQRRAQSLAIHPDLACLAPADFLPFVSAFLSRARPSTLLVIETELWPAMLRAADREGVRLVIANGRITERAFRRYQWVRGLMAPLLGTAMRAAVQTAADASRFAALGVSEAAIVVVGNLKNDIPAPSGPERAQARALLDGLGWKTSPVWAAGSTWPEEEPAILEAFLHLRREHPGLRLILAPRHVERCGETQRLLAQNGLLQAPLSSLASRLPGSPPPDCLLLDEIGSLAALYSVCDLAFVGGTLNGVGGHNLLEPAVASKPVIFGPDTSATDEVARALEFGGGGFRVKDGAALYYAARQLLADPAARELAGQRAAEAAKHLTGATRKTWDFLSPILLAES